ncbi:hypothetical protein GHK29_20435 [Sinorhizobium medicae]|uniref:oligopeptide/dipeptide ABC transporter ATP-binding protein n=1 Tax=Sinorhizobium medicae TaxID=110321 RepID=UPI0014164748|nr:hypothetical protein [Sinorhizobium medicae]MQU76915.1 hypothetical protein [Sinorhizobium medicae]
MESATRDLFNRPLHPYTEGGDARHSVHRCRYTALTCHRGHIPSLGDWPQGCLFHPRCPYSTAAC